MIEARATSRSDEVLARLRQKALRGLGRATVYLHTQLLQVLNVSAQPTRQRRLRTGRGGKKGSSYTVYARPSRPGEPPRKRTGWLQRNVVYAIDETTLTSRIGVRANAKYGLFLELGTRHMRPRPWLFVTAQRVLPQMRALLRAELEAA